MTDSEAARRVEPVLEGQAAQVTPISSNPAPVATAREAEPARAPRGDTMDQLGRIEEKAARIEEKFARTEALMQRVETASASLGDVARRSDVERLTDRVGKLPGFSALVATALITSVVTAALFVVIMRFLPGILAP